MGFEAGIIYTKTITMITEICCNCGIAFGVPSDFRDQCKEDEKKYFYCPNGHGQHYSETESHRLKKLLEKERQEAERRIQVQIDARKIVEGQLKRLHKGVCPCCNRSFPNLAAHLKTKHPELVGKAKEVSALNKKITAKQTADGSNSKK